MSPGDEWKPSAELRDLLLEVLEGRLSLQSPVVQTAMRGEPRFAASVQEALEVAKALEDLHAAERRALAAPSDPLEEVAVATARSQHREPPTSRAAHWPWVVLVLAAGLALATLLWGAGGSAPSPPEVPVHLGGAGSVRLAFESGELRLAPAPEPGQHYRIELRLDDKVLAPLILRRSDRLSVEELRKHGDDVWVRATLLQGDEELASSEFASLKMIMGR